MADNAHSFAELLSYALNDLSWAGVHVLAGLIHVGLFLVGLIGFVFSPADLDDVVNGRVPFGLTAKLPWAANALGMIGAFVNFALYASLIKVNQITTLDFPRQLYHKRQVIVLGGLTALSILCIGDLALALNLAAAARRYELLSASFWTICVIATIAALSCVAACVADLRKWYGQWRPDLLDSLQLEENQEQWAEDSLMGDDAPYTDSVDQPQLGEQNPDDRG